MKLLLVLAVLFVGLASSAAKNDETVYAKPNSSVGVVAVLNNQDIVPIEEFVTASKFVTKSQRYIFRFIEDAVLPADAKVVITIVNDEKLPPLTVSPEVGKATLNVAALSGSEITTAVLNSRARKEFLRALAFAFSAGGSQFPGNVMSISEISELDGVLEILPFDVMNTIAKVAKKRGLKPEIVADYYTACQEGWAPSPTTAEEQKIWDEVHEIPSEPIKIKFEKSKIH